VEPKKPEHLAAFPAAFLERLQDSPEAAQFVLGGYFALKHYLDYRETGDVDAWWRSREDPRALEAAREAFRQTADDFGYSVRERSWGETVSLEALDDTGNHLFSFQVAVRSIQVENPIASPWGSIAIETFADNIASKMQALVARGAPRDFVDIKKVVDASLVSITRCWELWAAKDPGITFSDARFRVRAHLESIEARMPIERLPAERRLAASELRAWFRDEFTTRPGEGGRELEEGLP